MMGKGSLSRLGGLVAVAAAGTLIAGCGSSNASKSASAPNASTGSSPSATFARAADVSSSAAGEKVSYSMNETASTGSIAINGSGAFNRSPAEGSMTMSLTEGGNNVGSFAIVIARNNFYMKFPSSLSGELQSVTGNKQWMTLNIGALGSAQNIPGLSSLMSGDAMNPTASLKELADSSTSGLTKVGTATINGISTTEYKATLNLAKEASAVPASERATIKALLAKDSSALGNTTIPVEVWIDNSDLVRQMTMNMTLKASGQTVPMTFKMDILAYGKQAAPAVPPASETFNITSLLKQEASSGGLSSLGG